MTRKISRRKSKSEDQWDDQWDETGQPSRPSLRRRPKSTAKKRRLWLYLLILFLMGIALLPNILVWTGTHNRAIKYLAADFQGEIKVHQAALGWLQPVQLMHVTVNDSHGNEILKADRIATDKTLVGILRSYFRENDLGELEILRPAIHWQVRPDGSNWEDAFAIYLANPSVGSKSADAKIRSAGDSSVAVTLPRFRLRIEQCQLLIESSTDDRFWQCENLEVDISTIDPLAPLKMAASSLVKTLGFDASGGFQELSEGHFKINTEFDPGANSLQLAAVNLELDADQLPMSMIVAVAQRAIGAATAQGELAARLTSAIDLRRLSAATDIQSLHLRGLELAAPQLIGSDRMNLKRITAEGKFELNSQQVASSGLRIESDFGQLQSNGRFNFSQLADLTNEVELLAEPLDLSGEIDLAGLARTLPETLNLQQDLVVEAGVIRFQASSRNDGDDRRLIFNVDATNLRGSRAGQPIVWQRPLQLNGALRQSGTQLEIESVKCESDFVQMAGRGNMQTGSFTIKGDLAAMMEQIGNFIDLTDIELAGQLDGQFGWQTDVLNQKSNQTPIQIVGGAEIQSPRIKFPQVTRWAPKQLVLAVNASGALTEGTDGNNGNLALASGGIKVDIGGDKLVASLVNPIESIWSEAIELDCQVEGSAAEWLAHVKNFVDLGTLQANGEMKLIARASLVDQGIRLTKIDGDFRQFAFAGYGMKVDEPEVKLTGDAIYHWTKKELKLQNLTVLSSALAIASDQLSVLIGTGMRFDGGLGFRGDVNRLTNWFQLSPTPDSLFYFGGAEGTLQMKSVANGTQAILSAAMSDFVLAQQSETSNPNNLVEAPQRQWVELFREPKTQIESELTLREDLDAIELEKLTLRGQSLALTAKGTLADLSNRFVTDLQGSWTPNWSQVQQLVSSYTGNSVRLAGSGSKPFQLQGPIFSASPVSELSETSGALETSKSKAWLPLELAASTAIRWEGGSFLEVPFGASEFTIDIRDSVGRMNTPGIPFSGGVIQAAPVVDFRGANPILVMQPTRVIDNVALSEATARHWLKFVAPLVADATSAQGNVTLDMQSVQMPLFEPASLDADGQIELENVVIGAGPLAEQLLGTVQQVRAILKPESRERDYRTWLKLDRQSIPFQIRDQFVYHQNVRIQVGDVMVVTQGAVGFDQSLNMMAEIPIADDWIEGKPFLSGLRGQSLKVPIGGSVTQPQLDRRVLQNFSTEIARAAAGGALKQVIADNITPQAEALQNRLNDKVSSEVNRLQDRLGDRLGQPLQNLGGLISGASPPPDGTPPGNQQQSPPARNIEDEILKGINDLFRRRK